MYKVCDEPFNHLCLISPTKSVVRWTRQSAERDESPITAHVCDAAIFQKEKIPGKLNFSSAPDLLYVKPLYHEKCRAERTISQTHRGGEPELQNMTYFLSSATGPLNHHQILVSLHHNFFFSF